MTMRSSIIPDSLIVKLFETLHGWRNAALAVSGGPDSVALMHLARRWCSLAGRDPSSISVLTVDHGLRLESKTEAEFVSRLANGLGFSHTTLTWQGEKPRTGVQAAARGARYALMSGYCHSHGVACLLTAHTEDDQAETLLMRLKRGSGLDGLAAIAPISERDGVSLVRPLLGVSKARLLAYLRERSLPFVRDPSNDNAAFERTGLRHSMQALTRAGLRRRSLAQSALRLNRAREAVASIASQLLDAHFLISPLAGGELDRDALEAVPDEIALHALARALELIGGETPPPRLLRLERLLGLRKLADWETTLGGCIIKATQRKVQFFREAGRIAKRELLLQPGEEAIWDARFRVSLTAGAAGPALIKPLGSKGWRLYREAAHDLPSGGKPPRLAALATPAAWEQDSLAAAPLLFWDSQSGQAAASLHVEIAPSLARFIKAN